jgi:hypothetical protein
MILTKARFVMNMHIYVSSLKKRFSIINDHLCGLVVRVPGYRSRGPGSIPALQDSLSSESGTGSTQPHEYSYSYLEENVAAPV